MALEKETVHVAMSGAGVIGRRHFLQTIGLGAAGVAVSAGIPVSFTDWMALHADDLRKRQMACILLWMAGGPSQLETFDPKPGTAARRRDPRHPDGGLRHLDRRGLGPDRQGHERHRPHSLDDQQGGQPPARDLSASHRLRSLGDDQAPAYRLLDRQRAGRKQVRSPAHRQHRRRRRSARAFWAPPSSRSSSRIPSSRPRIPSPGSAPIDSGAGSACSIDSKAPASSAPAAADRVKDHRALYHQTAKMILSPNMRAFNLDEEPEPLRDAYGRTPFGQGCMLARRLVQAGVTFVEVRSNGWDTHQQNHQKVGELAKQVDPAFATLITDLKQRGMLENTLVVWMGEFGRTPKINPSAGRDHFPKVFNVALAGGGVKGGQVIGASTADGSDVKDHPVSVPDLLASICHTLKVDTSKEMMSPIGRPIKIVDGGKPVSGPLLMR